jgi:hypothetical protein
MNKRDLIKKKNVVVVLTGKKVVAGLETNRDAIRVGVTRKIPEAQLARKDVIPKRVKGMETDVFETEEIKALDDTAKYRPAPGGVSGGHPKVTAGTISPFRLDGVLYIISNNHVIANCNDCSLGDQTWQPGAYDGGQAQDTIGHLAIWCPIIYEEGESSCPIAGFAARILNGLAKLFHSKSRLRPVSEGVNLVDCAVSRPLDDSDILEEILDIGKPAGFAEAKRGEFVKKRGRTSLLTEGVVLDTEGVSRVNYGEGRTAVFEDQIITTKLADPGDSGSLVLNDKNEIVGLLFGGSEQMTIVNKISNVIAEMG